MKPARTIFLSIALTGFSVVGQAQTSQTDSPELKESRELTAKVVQLFGEHKFDEALPLAKRVIELAESALEFVGVTK